MPRHNLSEFSLSTKENFKTQILSFVLYIGIQHNQVDQLGVWL